MSKIAPLVIATCFACTSLAAAQTYTVYDLGTLPGGTVSGTADINAAGSVVGSSTITNNPWNSPRHAFLFTKGQPLVDLNPSNATYSTGAGINDAGHVAGSVQLSSSTYQSVGLWTAPGSFTDLGLMPSGTWVYVSGIGAGDTVIGSGRSDSTGYSHGAVWRPGSPGQDLHPFIPGIEAFLHGISDNAAFAAGRRAPGDGTLAAFRIDLATNVRTDLGTIGTIREAFGINNAGDAVGWADIGGGNNQAVLWKAGGGQTVIGTLPGLGTSHAADINNQGVVVGASGSLWASRAFIWNGTLKDLNTLVPPGSPPIHYAAAINDAGQIAAGMLVGNGLGRAALLSICGNGIVDPGDQCDEGAVNGTATSCCDQYCRFKPAGSTCRAAVGACDAADVCTGTSVTCGLDAKLPSGTPCTPDADVCTRDECDGTSNACQHPAFPGCVPASSTQATVGGPTNLCTGGTVVPGGCRLTAGNATLTIPNGALPMATNLNLVGLNSATCTSFNSLQGNSGRIVSCLELLPEGLTFAIPVELRLVWTNCPNQCDVTWSGGCGSPLGEGRLRVFLDGVPVANPCDASTCPTPAPPGNLPQPCLDPTLCAQSICNPLTNQITITGLRHFSEYALARGERGKRRGCFLKRLFHWGHD